MWRTLSRRHSPKYVPQQQRRYSGEVSLFALSYILGEQRRGVTTPVSRLEQTLNKPKVVLVVGVVAVALNILLYFGYFLPRMTPLIAHISPIGTSLPEVFVPDEGTKSDSETGSKAAPESNSKSDAEAVSGSASASPSASPSASSSDPSAGSPPPQQQSSSSPEASASPGASASPESSPPPPQQQSNSPPEPPPLPEASPPLREANPPP